MLRSLTLQTFLTNASMLLVGIVTSVLLSRWLGPTGRGEVTAALLWPVLFIYLGNMGMMPATVHFSALPGSKSGTIFATLLFFMVVQSVVVTLIGFFVLPWLLSSQQAPIIEASRWYLLVIPISLVSQYGARILQGRMNIAAWNLLQVIIPAGYLIGVVVLQSQHQLTVLNIVVLHLGLGVFASVVTLFLLHAAGVLRELRVDRTLAKQMFRYGSTVHIGSVAQVTNLQLDQTLMAAWLPPAQLGLYVTAVSATSVVQVFAQVIRTLAQPVITQAPRHDERLSLLTVMFRRYWFLSLLSALLLSGVLPYLIPFVFGEDFRDAIWPAEILLLAACFEGARVVLTAGAWSLEDPWLGSRAALLALVVTGILLVMLLPLFGITGAAIASLGAYATAVGVLVFGLARNYDIKPARLFSIGHGEFNTLVSDIRRLWGEVRRTAVRTPTVRVGESDS